MLITADSGVPHFSRCLTNICWGSHDAYLCHDKDLPALQHTHDYLHIGICIYENIWCTRICA